MPAAPPMVLDPRSDAPVDWSAIAAQEFDKVCSLMPERSNVRIAVRLSQMLGFPVSRFAVSDWRKGKTNVQYRVVCAARQAAGVRISIDLNLSRE